MEQLSEVAATWPITDLGSHFANFADTAAVIRNLELVITVDTAIAHCTGALGVPVWVALPFASDWRWMQDRDDSPWYPSVRLFRQQQWGNWDEVVDRMVTELKSLLQRGARRRGCMAREFSRHGSGATGHGW